MQWPTDCWIDISRQEASPEGFHPVQRRNGSTYALCCHFYLLNCSIFIKSDRFQAGFPHGRTGMSRTMISNIPLPVYLNNTSMVIHQVSSTAPIVDNHTPESVRSQRRSGRSIIQRGTIGFTMTLVPAINIIINTIPFTHRTGLVKSMFLISQQTIPYAAFD